MTDSNHSSTSPLSHHSYGRRNCPALIFQIKFWLGFIYGQSAFLSIAWLYEHRGTPGFPPLLFGFPIKGLLSIAILVGIPLLMLLTNSFLLPWLGLMDPPRWIGWSKKKRTQAVNTDAWVYYAHLLIEGRVVPKDLQEAEKWIRRAAKAGNTHAQNWLAKLERYTKEMKQKK